MGKFVYFSYVASLPAQRKQKTEQNETQLSQGSSRFADIYIFCDFVLGEIKNWDTFVYLCVYKFSVLYLRRNKFKADLKFR